MQLRRYFERVGYCGDVRPDPDVLAALQSLHVSSIGGGEFSFDFLPRPASEEALRDKCTSLQTDPSSSFVTFAIRAR